jgi:hypothetical protein
MGLFGNNIFGTKSYTTKKVEELINGALNKTNNAFKSIDKWQIEQHKNASRDPAEKRQLETDAFNEANKKRKDAAEELAKELHGIASMIEQDNKIVFK